MLAPAVVSAAAMHAAMHAAAAAMPTGTAGTTTIIPAGTIVPATPALGSAPAQTAPEGEAAPIPAGSLPTIAVPAIITSAKGELSLFERKLIVGQPFETGDGRRGGRHRSACRSFSRHECDRRCY